MPARSACTSLRGATMLLEHVKPKPLSVTEASMKLTIVAVVFALTSGTAEAQQSLCGVWKPVEVFIESGPDAGRHTTDI